MTDSSPNTKPVKSGTNEIPNVPLDEPENPKLQEVEATHLRPDNFEVPATNPYQHDTLDRRDFANSLSKLIQFGTGSGVIAIDGGWGSGKTSFVRMWAQDARQRGHVVALINAWDGDYQGSALKFIATRLAAELKQAIPVKDYKNWLKRTWEWISQNIGRILKTGAIVSAPFNGGAISVSLRLVAELLESLESVTGDTQEDAKQLERIRDNLRATSQGIYEGSGSESGQNGESKRLIIVIDELDRCRPDYAVQFMETIKHVFQVDHVTFVVAVNMEQLQHTVKGLYGNDFDGKGYLERFFDFRLTLPAGSRQEFVKKAVEQSRLAQFFGMELPRSSDYKNITASGLLTYMFAHSLISLREIQKALKHIQVLLLFDSARLGEDVLSAVTLAALRAIEPRSYNAIESGMRGRRDALTRLASALGKSSLGYEKEAMFLKDIVHSSCMAVEDEYKAEGRSRREVPPDDFEGNVYEIPEQFRNRAGIANYKRVREIIEMTARTVDSK